MLDESHGDASEVGEERGRAFGDADAAEVAVVDQEPKRSVSRGVSVQVSGEALAADVGVAAWNA